MDRIDSMLMRGAAKVAGRLERKEIGLTWTVSERAFRLSLGFIRCDIWVYGLLAAVLTVTGYLGGSIILSMVAVSCTMEAKLTRRTIDAIQAARRGDESGIAYVGIRFPMARRRALLFAILNGCFFSFFAYASGLRHGSMLLWDSAIVLFFSRAIIETTECVGYYLACNAHIPPSARQDRKLLRDLMDKVRESMPSPIPEPSGA